MKKEMSDNMTETEEKVRKIVENALKNNFPSETHKNHIVGGGVGSDYSYSFYNPHNARFYFRFDKWNFKPSPDFVLINSGHELKLDSFMGCKFVVKKSQIEVTNLINSVRRFTVSGSDADRDEACKRAVAILELECINVFRRFVSVFGGASDFVVVKRHVPDNKVLHDEIIDTLDLESTWNDDVSKKVYKDAPLNVEFKKPVFAANYFRNAGLRSFAPEIVSEINSLRNEVSSLRGETTLLAHESRVLAEHFNSHIPLIQEATRSLKDDVVVKEETLLTLKSIRDNAQLGGGFESHAPYSSPSPHPENVGRDFSLNPRSLDSSLLTISKFDDVATVKRKRLLYYKEVFGW